MLRTSSQTPRARKPTSSRAPTACRCRPRHRRPRHGSLTGRERCDGGTGPGEAGKGRALCMIRVLNVTKPQEKQMLLCDKLSPERVSALLHSRISPRKNGQAQAHCRHVYTRDLIQSTRAHSGTTHNGQKVQTTTGRQL